MSLRSKTRNRSSSLFGQKTTFHLIQQPFSENIQDYEILSTVGVLEDISHGYLAKHTPTGRYVSLKLTDLNMSTEFDLITEMIEITRNTKKCCHDNILNYYTSFIEQERLWTVLDPIRLGSIKQILCDNFPSGINESLIATIIRDVLKAVSYLHERNCIHNNIRADNIYLDANGEVKLGGLHQMTELMASGELKRSVFKFVGDPEYMAPEVLSQATTFNEKVDIYSIGMTSIELFHGRTPFEGWPALKILLCKLHYEIPQVESSKQMTKVLSRFIERCCHKYPRLRPKATELIEDSFIKTARSSHYIENHLVKKMISSPPTEIIYDSVSPSLPSPNSPISNNLLVEKVQET